MSIRARIAKLQQSIGRQGFMMDMLVYGAGNVLSRGLWIFLLPLCTRRLTPEQYGLVDMIVVFNSFAINVCLLGTNSGLAVLFQEKDAVERDRIAAITLKFVAIVSFTVATLLIGFSQWVSPLLFAGQTLVAVCMVGFFVIPFKALFSAFQNIYKYYFQPLQFSKFAIVNALLIGLLCVATVIGAGMEAIGVLASMLLGNIISSGLSARRIMRALPMATPLRFAALKPVLALGLPTAWGGILTLLIPNVSRVMLSHLSGMAAVGIFGAAYVLCSALIVLQAAFAHSYIPSALAIQDSPRAPVIYRSVASIYLGVLFIIASTIIVWGKPIVNVVIANPQYGDALTLLPPLLLSFAMTAAQPSFSFCLAITRANYHLVWIFLCGFALSVPANYFLIMSYGVQGGAWAALVVQSTITALYYVMCARTRLFEYPWVRALLCVCAYAVVMLCTQFIDSRAQDLPSLLQRLGATFVIVMGYKYIMGLRVREMRDTLNFRVRDLNASVTEP